jgi:hypothetical protein
VKMPSLHPFRHKIARHHRDQRLFAVNHQRTTPMKVSALIAGLAAATTLSGCVVAPAPVAPPYYSQPIMVAPPPPRVEYIGQPPFPGYVWIGGYWRWTGARHDWVQGRWEAPRPGYSWTPHRWEQEGQHWRQTGGQWERHDARRDRHDEHHGHGD